jgi:hypothetical protein
MAADQSSAGIRAFPSAIPSPFLEAASCFFQGDNRGPATSHRRPPYGISGGRTTLTVIGGPIHASLPQTHEVFIDSGVQSAQNQLFCMPVFVEVRRACRLIARQSALARILATV